MNDVKVSKHSFFNSYTFKQIKKYKFLYLLLLPATVLVIIFSYLPMAGIKMAFQNYNIYNPAASTWVGLQNFKEIFTIPNCVKSIVNTIHISILNIVICSVSLNSTKSKFGICNEYIKLDLFFLIEISFFD